MVDAALVGYGLLGLGALLFLIEVVSPGFFLAIPATILLLLGALAFAIPFDQWLQVAPLAVLLVGAPATAATIWFYRRMSPPAKAPQTLSADSLLGTEALVQREVKSGTARGKVRLGQEDWSATTDGPPIPEGTRVRVVRVEGVVLTVAPTEGEGG